MKKRILVAPLNWGLGHATRCIPIINALITQGFEPIIASDGVALQLLQKEFPQLTHIEIPSYNITYAKKGSLFKLKLIKDSPKMLKAFKAEKKAIKKIVADYKIDGIISDNRFGVYSKHIPSAFITHQLQVLSGTTTWFSTKIHHKIIKKFNECWVPDNLDAPNLSGKLGHIDTPIIKTKYIGPLSRLKKTFESPQYDVMVLLSGPEPQRSFLEEKLLHEFNSFNGKVVFVKGKIEHSQTKETFNNITVVNFMTSNELENTINKSKLIISRSGYTTVMDLAKLSKKAFFIPTPGQTEQEYLAKKLDDDGLVPYCNQNDFTIKALEKVKDYQGLTTFDYEVNYKKLFGLF
ncbi:glycosyltransferase [Mangrovimonas spongiae]|uniref:Glycosyltransferase n=1 Tax=Mangrovimonas spongiae TaxID=2494697 RepID=A0A428K6U8_9FLAO|nr:glycosyltransferase [Mangrovimonas spongiae]